MSVIQIPTGAAIDGWRVEKRGGTHRFVKLLPTPFGERPCIWASQDTRPGEDGAPCFAAVVLLSRDPPETMRVNVPVPIWEQLPTGPVEW